MTAKARKLSQSDVKSWLQLEDKQIFAGDATDERDGYPVSAGFARFGRGEEADVPVPYDEVWVVTSGTLAIRDGDGGLTASAGEAVYVPAHAPGVVQAMDDTELVTVTYPPRWQAFAEAAQPSQAPGAASPTRMSRAEREGFLSERHVGILSVADADGRGPLTVPIGYDYEPGGDIVFATSASSRKLGLIRTGARVGFIVQTDTLPYKYVAIEGPVASIEPEDPEVSYDRTVRHLGRELGERFLETLETDEETEAPDEAMAVRIRPERWRTYDSGKIPPFDTL